MNTYHFIKKSLFRYKSFYRLIAIAVIVAVAVITGSLLVGSSVRETLIKRVEERLGKTETIIFSQYSYLHDAILDDLCNQAELPHATSLRGVLLINGFVSVSGKLIPVMVWGVDDLNIEKGKAKTNRALVDEMNAVEARHDKPIQQQEQIVLRLPAAGMIPLGSMFVTDTYTTSLRLEFDSSVSVEQGGDINMKNEQTIPFNVFVNREELSETLGVSGKINLILADRIISNADFAAAWNYSQSGLKILSRHSALENEYPESRELWDNPEVTVTSDRIFIQDKVVETICKPDLKYNRIFTYLANSIGKNNQTIPYSFIAAADYYNEQKLNPDEIILSDYAAKRLNVSLNDTISISYFVSEQLKTLVTDSLFLKVGKIVPLIDLQSNKSLSAEFPGLSDVARCTDWNSDLPIKMNLITAEDEAYWALYKNTPKAIVPYATFSPQWKNAFGSATAIHINNTDCLKNLTPEMFDIQIIYPREEGVIAAKSGVNFSSLFLSLGFFIIISAAMLMIVPLSEMLFCRREERRLLAATGFSDKRIFRLLWRESILVVFFSALFGVIAGLAYTYLVLFLLGTVWKGATHTVGFQVYPDLMTILVGLTSGIVLALSLLYIGIFRALKTKSTTNSLPVKNKRRFFNIRKDLKNNILNYFTSLRFNTSKLIWASILYARKRAVLSFIALASGVFVVFSVGLNRQGFADSSRIRTATGGFSLWCETIVPVYHNIQTKEGRAKLGLPSETQFLESMQLLKQSADDASCLNLNKIVRPNVLGIEIDKLQNSDFKISKTVFEECSVFEKMKTAENSLYPALVDETVLTWSLGKKLGDTLVYMGEKGKVVSILLAGTIKNSIFQGYILIDKALFSEIWGEIAGSEIMLLKVPEEEVAHTKAIISQALNNYGVRVTTTGERLQLFYSVMDTYLTIFFTLGGLGLLLGIFSFVIVVRKNLMVRMEEIVLLLSLGFEKKRIIDLLFKENIIIPLCAILTGVSGSLVSISIGFGNVSGSVLTIAGLFLVGFIGCVVVFIRVSCFQCCNFFQHKKKEI